MKLKTLLIILTPLLLTSDAFAQNRKDILVELAHTSGTTVTRAQLLSDPKLADKNGMCNVTHFVITFFPKGHDLVGPFSTNGNTLTAAEIGIIKNIKAAGSDGQPRSLNSIELKMTE